MGSSPLTRGKPLTAIVPRGTTGLIPAHAGKTSHPTARLSPRAAHPRSRGENVQVTGAALDPKGSSPLTRGKRLQDRREGCARGLIPAHAGKTHGARSALDGLRAHPRSRGENTESTGYNSSPRGSSPLTRGKPIAALAKTLAPGLIPAHAGKTKTVRKPPDSWGAHPRSRGENPLTDSAPRVQRGSSPLTRGKRKGLSSRRNQERLIPAHAGKTLGG